MPEGIHVDNFLRADMVLISEAALSAKLKNSSDTLLDKLKAQDDEVEMSNSIPAWNKVYTPGMSVQTADELDALILAAVRNLVPQFEKTRIIHGDNTNPKGWNYEKAERSDVCLYLFSLYVADNASASGSTGVDGG